MRQIFLPCFSIAILVLAFVPTAFHLRAAEPNDELNEKALRLLREKCWNCHGAEKQEGDLRLDLRDNFLKGGSLGSAFDAKDASKSLLLKTVRGEIADLQMPPKDPLSKDQIELLNRWLQAGAAWPRTNQGMQSSERMGDAWSDPNNPIRKKFGGERLDLWSLKPITRPALPEVKHTAWSRNPIDVFVAAKLEQEGLAPATDATPAELAKRLASDLTGLPPTIELIEQLRSQDGAEESNYNRAVDRLLASPEHGVHLARMWLDVVRYSDSNGFDWDELRPQAYRYRDYVVRALNRDIPYDQFITEQLAGDLLQPDPPKTEVEQDRLIATGYLRLGPHDNAAKLFNEQDRSRAELMADLTETTGSALLGLTMSCCRCHDHKTDPLSHEDHYRLRAFFAGVEFADDLPLDLADEQARIREQHESIDREIEPIERSLKELDKSAKEKIAELKKSKQALEAKKLSFTTGLVMREAEKDKPKTFVFYQGDHRSPRQEVEPGVPSVLDPNPMLSPRPVDEPRSSPSRRDLAEWVTSKGNPWTARVIVNRLWQVYFGEGLVATANDFGISGQPPTHPELLDWLASELIDSGWSLKHIERLIVSSSTYRQKAIPGGQLRDSNGQVVASMRKQLRRLTAEQMRDALLSVAGLLQYRQSGPPVWPELPPEILQANPAFLDDNPMKTKGWYPSPVSEQTARSLFLIQKRTVRVPWLETFDLPENSVSCARRENSLVAPQALALLNSSLAEEAAKAIQRQFELDGSVAKNDPSNLSKLFRQILQREPSPSEIEACSRFLEQRSIAELARSLFNTNEFAFVP